MQLQLDNNKKELKSHGTYAFPVNVSYEQLPAMKESLSLALA